MARLLLIDDDDTTREVLAHLLRVDGWEVAEVASGEAAVRLAPSFAAEVVLCDLHMPGVCGPELAAALRSACHDMPTVLAITAKRSPEVLPGYDALLVKPFAAAAVREALSGVKPFVDAMHTGAPVLAIETVDRLRNAMPSSQIRSLYDLALQDAERRLCSMESSHDEAVIRAAAHALKGSCAMIGAERLAALAADVEAGGLPDSSGKVQRIADFRGEISALRRMLERLFTSDI